MRTKKLISFDFDDTLVKTPLPEEGKIVWKEKTGTDWPHRGWWSKPESLDMEIFDIPLNKHIYKEYETALSDPENYIVLATGRITKLRDEVDIILDHYGLDFDEIHLNPGTDTYEFKKQLFSDLIDNLQPEEYIMYDDRDEHLERFVKWAKTLPCKTTIIDAKTGQVFQEKKNIEETILRIIREETNKPKRINNNDTFQYLIDMEMERMKEICYEQDSENTTDMVSFDVCDFLEYAKPEVEVTGIDNHNDKLVIIVKIKVSTRQWYKDEESFVDELERRLIKWIGNNIIEAEDINFK